MSIKRDYISPAHWSILAEHLGDSIDPNAVVAEYRFHPDRKWRFDIAIPSRKIAVEIDGGVFIRGGHARGRRIMKDHEKANTAQVMGWIVLRCTPDEWDSGAAMRTLREAIDSRATQPQIGAS